MTAFYYGTPGDDNIVGKRKDSVAYFDMSQGGDDTVVAMRTVAIIKFGATFDIHDSVTGTDSLGDQLWIDNVHQDTVISDWSNVRGIESFRVGTYDAVYTLSGDMPFTEIASYGAPLHVDHSQSTVVARIIGGAGDDYLAAGPSEDFLYGSDGSDTLVGSDSGYSMLESGTGADQLYSGSGETEFVFDYSRFDSPKGAIDTVYDWHHGDQITIYGANHLADKDAQRELGDVVIIHNRLDTITKVVAYITDRHQPDVVVRFIGHYDFTASDFNLWNAPIETKAPVATHLDWSAAHSPEHPLLSLGHLALA